MLPRPVSGALTAAAGAAVLVGGLLGGASPAAAAPDVTTTADGGAGSLRAAVLAADASGAAEVIELPPGTYALTRCGADDTGANGDLDLTTAAAVTLRAPSGGVTIRPDLHRRARAAVPRRGRPDGRPARDGQAAR